MSDSIIYGDFDSERFWRPKSLATLPSIVDPQTRNIVMAMDEILFVLCAEYNDLFITRFEFDSIQKEYLKNFGFSPQNHCLEKGLQYEHTLDRLLFNDKTILNHLNTLRPNTAITYSIQKDKNKVCKLIEDKSDLPEYELVTRLNSKEFSFDYRAKIDKSFGFHAECLSDFDTKGNILLKSHGSIVIKDTYGVSGNGNLKIDSKGIFERIVRYLAKQEKEGKLISFIIEPFLNVETDFSCLFVINKDGDINIISVNKLVNKGFSFSKILDLDTKSVTILEKFKYFETILKIGKEMYKQGYFGPVCVDSMITKSKKLIPIVEINARYSMGFIYRYFGKRIYDNKFTLMYLDLIIQSSSFYHDLIFQLEKCKLLYGVSSNFGIAPISPNCTMINKILGNIPAHGRLIFFVIFNNKLNESSLINKLNEIIKQVNSIDKIS